MTAHKNNIDTNIVSDGVTRDISDLCVRWLDVVTLYKSSNRKILGAFPAFKKLQKDCTPLGLRTCASLVCPRGGVQRASFFSLNSDVASGNVVFCKLCANGEWKAKATAANAEHKVAVAARISASPRVQNAGAVEDEAMRWLKPQMEVWFPGIDVVVLPEFRHADFCVRLAEWPVGLYLPGQLKSNSPFKQDGQLRPNNSVDVAKNGGAATFSNCNGYDGLLMIFVKTRHDPTGAVHRTLWCTWGEHVKTTASTQTQCTERSDGCLGNISPCPSSWISSSTSESLLGTLRDVDTTRLCTIRDAWMDVRQQFQRKELAAMLALEQIFDVTFSTGFQTAVDCHCGGKATQVKTFDVGSRHSHVSHCTKGHKYRPYSSSDGIEQLVEVLVVKSGEFFYMLYAMQHRDALVEHGVFAHEDEPGKTCLYVPLGSYAKWLTGEDAGAPRKQTKWLIGSEHGFRPPTQLSETEYLTRELLEEVSWTAKRPDLFPGFF